MPPPLHFPTTFQAWFALTSLKEGESWHAFRWVCSTCVYPLLPSYSRNNTFSLLHFPALHALGVFARGRCSPGLGEALMLFIYVYKSNISSQCYSRLHKFMPKKLQFKPPHPHTYTPDSQPGTWKSKKEIEAFPLLPWIYTCPPL